MFDNVRRVSRQLFAYGTADVSVLVINFVLLPVYTRVLSPDEYGAFALLLVFEAFLKPVLRCGMDAAYLRYYFDCRTSVERQTLGCTELLFTVLLNSAALLILWPVAPWLTQALIGSHAYVLAVRLVTLNTVLSNVVVLPLAQFRADERSTLVGTLNFFRAFATTAVRLVLVVWLRRGVTGLALADVVVTSVLAVGLVPHLRRMAEGRFSTPVLKDVLRYGFPQVPTGVLSQVMAMSDRYVLGIYLALDRVGVYSIGSTMASMLKLFPVAFETAWMPFAFSSLRRRDAPEVFARFATYAFTVLAFGALGTTLLAGPVVRLALPRTFQEAPTVVPLLVLGIIFQVAAWFLNTSLNVTKRTSMYPITTAAGAVASLLGSVVCIPVWGLRGAAMGTLLGQVALFGVTSWVAQRAYRIPYETRRLTKTAAVTVALYLAGTAARTGSDWTDIFVSAALLAAFPLLLLCVRFLHGWEREAIGQHLGATRRDG